MIVTLCHDALISENCCGRIFHNSPIHLIYWLLIKTLIFSNRHLDQLWMRKSKQDDEAGYFKNVITGFYNQSKVVQWHLDLPRDYLQNDVKPSTLKYGRFFRNGLFPKLKVYTYVFTNLADNGVTLYGKFGEDQGFYNCGYRHEVQKYCCY